MIWGSASLVDALLAAGLVDELNLMIEPILLGGGKRIFPDDGTARPLQLVKCVTAGTGVQVCTLPPRIRPSAILHRARSRRHAGDVVARAATDGGAAAEPEPVVPRLRRARHRTWVNCWTVPVPIESASRPSLSRTWLAIDRSLCMSGSRSTTPAPPRRLSTNLLMTRTFPSPSAVTAAPTSISRKGPFPLVVISHGSEAAGVYYSGYAEMMASYGYVVAAPNHTGNSSLDPSGVGDEQTTITARSTPRYHRSHHRDAQCRQQTDRNVCGQHRSKQDRRPRPLERRDHSL